MRAGGNSQAPAPRSGRDARVDCPIDWIVTSRRALRACRSIGVLTVGDFLRCNRADILAVRGCGRHTLANIESAIEDFLDDVPADVPAGVRDDGGNRTAVRSGAPLLLDAIVQDHRATRAFRELGITTVQEFLDTPRATLLAVHGFGMRTYQRVLRRVRTFSRPRRATTGLLPPTLLHFPIEQLELDSARLNTLRDLGLGTVGDLLADDLGVHNALGSDGREAVREALGRLLHRGLAGSATARTRSFAQLSARLLSLLSLDHQDLVRRRLGLGSRAHSLARLAALRQTTPQQISVTLGTIQRELRAHADDLLDPVRAEGRRLLDEQAGIATPDCLDPGTLLHAAAQESEDSLVPFRLLALCYPGEFFVLGTALTRTPPHRVAALRKALPRLTRPAHLPVTVAELEARLEALDLPTDRGLLLHLLLAAGLTVAGDASPGEMRVFRADPVVERVIEILRGSARPLAVEDIFFHYRDRHRSCHKGRLLEHLRADCRLLEIGRSTWALRERHLADLEAVAEQAAGLAAIIHERGGHHGVRTLLVGEAAVDERTAYLITSWLRRDPSLRDLGRGEFCSVRQPMSALMKEIHTALSRAMGELPVSRFLDNQGPERRRAVARLLRENRMFVEPAPDRVDLLTNYPFNPDRLLELRTLVEEHLAGRGGYSNLDEVLAMVQATRLGGEYLTRHLLGDLLRRHGGFEVLPGGFIADAHLGLGGWIQQKAREVLRQADLPLTPHEILGEVPELAEFTESLEVLLVQDPLVQSADSMHYTVV